MKKLLVGCLVVAVLGAVTLAVAAWFLYRAASPVIENARGYLQQMSALDELEKRIANTTPHAAPESGELTEAQVARFARVQEGVRTALGQRFDAIQAKYERLKGDAGERTPPTVSDVLGALSDLANVFVEARRYQVDALNQEGFSRAEYAWVRDRVFQAAGMEVSSMVDLDQLARAVREGTGVESIGAPRVPTPDVPERNRALVKPHLGQMDRWIPLAFFGL